MAITDMRTGSNEFVPEKDATKKLDDGREIVIARAGTPMPMAQAIEYGLVKDPAESKAAAETKKESSDPENKAEQSAPENKVAPAATTAPKGKGGKSK